MLLNSHLWRVLGFSSFVFVSFCGVVYATSDQKTPDNEEAVVSPDPSSPPEPLPGGHNTTKESMFDHPFVYDSHVTEGDGIPSNIYHTDHNTLHADEDHVYYLGISEADAHNILEKYQGSVSLSSLPEEQEAYESMMAYARDEDVEKAIEICKVYVEPQVMRLPKNTENIVSTFPDDSVLSSGGNTAVEQDSPLVISGTVDKDYSEDVTTDDVSDKTLSTPYLTEDTISPESPTEDDENTEGRDDELVESDTSSKNSDDEQDDEDNLQGSADASVGDDSDSDNVNTAQDIAASQITTSPIKQMPPVLSQQSAIPMVQYAIPSTQVISAPTVPLTQPALVSQQPNVVPVSSQNIPVQPSALPASLTSEHGAESNKNNDEEKDDKSSDNTVITINVNTADDGDDESDDRYSAGNDNEDAQEDKSIPASQDTGANNTTENIASLADEESEKTSELTNNGPHGTEEFAAAAENTLNDRVASPNHDTITSTAYSVADHNEPKVIENQSEETDADDSAKHIKGDDEQKSTESVEETNDQGDYEETVTDTETRVVDSSDALHKLPVQFVDVFDAGNSSPSHDTMCAVNQTIVSVPQVSFVQDDNKYIGEYAAYMNTREPVIHVDSSVIQRMVTGERMKYTYKKHIRDAKSARCDEEPDAVQVVLRACSSPERRARVQADTHVTVCSKRMPLAPLTYASQIKNINVVAKNIHSDEFYVDSLPKENVQRYSTITSQNIVDSQNTTVSSQAIIENKNAIPEDQRTYTHQAATLEPITTKTPEICEPPAVSMRLQLALHTPDGKPLAAIVSRGNPDVTYLQLSTDVIARNSARKNSNEFSSATQKKLAQSSVTFNDSVMKTPFYRQKYVRRNFVFPQMKQVQKYSMRLPSTKRRVYMYNPKSVLLKSSKMQKNPSYPPMPPYSYAAQYIKK